MRLERHAGVRAQDTKNGPNWIGGTHLCLRVEAIKARPVEGVSLVDAEISGCGFRRGNCARTLRRWSAAGEDDMRRRRSRKAKHEGDSRHSGIGSRGSAEISPHRLADGQIAVWEGSRRALDSLRALWGLGGLWALGALRTGSALRPRGAARQLA